MELSNRANSVALPTVSPAFKPITGNGLVRACKRTACAIRITALAFQAILYYTVTAIAVAIRTPLTHRLGNELGWKPFKDHIILLSKAIRTGVVAPYTAWNTPSSEQIRLKLQLDLFPYQQTYQATDLSQLARIACNNRDMKLLDQVIASGVSLDPYLLVLAFDEEDTAIVTKLIKAGIDVKQTNMVNRAAADNDVKKIAKLAELGFPIDEYNKWNETPLGCAVDSQRRDAVAKLLELGVDPNKKTSYWNDELRTPLMINRDPDIATLLVKKGADVNIQTDDGLTAVHCTTFVHDFNPELLRTLVKLGADVNIKDKKGKTALDYAIEWKNIPAANTLKELGALSSSKSWFSRS